MTRMTGDSISARRPAATQKNGAFAACPCTSPFERSDGHTDEALTHFGHEQLKDMRSTKMQLLRAAQTK
jgi:hypothetical protein